jgi:4-hydroxythreonine-4-phosphate dehydrogenase
MDTNRIPVVALALGDPAGVGPELIARLLAGPEAVTLANTVIVGDDWLWAEGQSVAGVKIEVSRISSLAEVRDRGNTSRPAFLPLETASKSDVHYGKAEAAGGKSCLKVLNLCMDAIKAGQIDAICFAPLNKQAMKLGGMHHDDELHHFAEYLGVKGFLCEFNTLGDLWTSRISSHVPMKDIATYITGERIRTASELIYRSLLANGIKQPRVAIAAFNPHGGDGGTCGREEVDIIGPAVQELQARKWPTDSPFHGPFPADTIFLKARDGEYNAVVTMYHDQGQIAMKLLGFQLGVTTYGGLSVPITTPAQGSAYDIAGQGKANPQAMKHAFQMASRMGRVYREQAK